MAQQVKDATLSLLWVWFNPWLYPWLQLGDGFDPWPWDFCMPRVLPEKLKKINAQTVLLFKQRLGFWLRGRGGNLI